MIEEYFQMGHAEKVPVLDLHKPVEQVFYLPMHAVRKESSTTTKVRAVFDASAKSSTGVSLNDLLLVGPTIHFSLVDVLLRFRFYRIALTADISKMYRAIELVQSDKDLHRFVWRQSPEEPLQDFRMTRVTFGVSASSCAANMSVKQNSLGFSSDYPLAASVVDKSFYVDDCLSGADTPEEAFELHQQLPDLFNRGGFTLHKWNSSDLTVLELRDSQLMHVIHGSSEYTKTLGIAWNPSSDHFRLMIANLPPLQNLTKRTLVSDIAKTFDVLGWFSPAIIKMKILLQQLWEQRIDWDDVVPEQIRDSWMQWRTELDLLSTKHIPRCYYSKTSHISVIELHGFCDASEKAYAAVVNLRMTDSDGSVQVSLVSSKTKVAPIKKLTIPRLELCGAYLLADLLHHVKQVFDLSLNQVYAWTDSTIVLSWLVGDPRRFKTFVNNRVAHIVELIGPEHWNHVSGEENPADCASRGLFPTELLQHSLWWNGPKWF